MNFLIIDGEGTQTLQFLSLKVQRYAVEVLYDAAYALKMAIELLEDLTLTASPAMRSCGMNLLERLRRPRGPEV